MTKALDAGVDIICAQGGEGGGHTGDVPTSVLIPVVADLCRHGTLPSYHSYQATIAKLHAANKLVMNMVGAPKHVSKVREVSK